MPPNTYFDLNNINYQQLKEQIKMELQNESNHRPHHLTNRKKLTHRLKLDPETSSVDSMPEEMSEFDEDNDLARLRRNFLANGNF